jgi:hypothetical protein
MVCLPVASESESTAVIGFPDASTMPPGRVGRAFMVSDNQLWQVQPAWGGAPFGPAAEVPVRVAPMRWQAAGTHRR